MFFKQQEHKANTLWAEGWVSNYEIIRNRFEDIFALEPTGPNYEKEHSLGQRPHVAGGPDVQGESGFVFAGASMVRGDLRWGLGGER